jgi:hypothetical protein
MGNKLSIDRAPGRVSPGAQAVLTANADNARSTRTVRCAGHTPQRECNGAGDVHVVQSAGRDSALGGSASSPKLPAVCKREKLLTPKIRSLDVHATPGLDG